MHKGDGDGFVENQKGAPLGPFHLSQTKWPLERLAGVKAVKSATTADFLAFAKRWGGGGGGGGSRINYIQTAQ